MNHFDGVESESRSFVETDCFGDVNPSFIGYIVVAHAQETGSKLGPRNSPTEQFDRHNTDPVARPNLRMANSVAFSFLLIRQ